MLNGPLEGPGEGVLVVRAGLWGAAAFWPRQGRVLLENTSTDRSCESRRPFSVSLAPTPRSSVPGDPLPEDLEVPVACLCTAGTQAGGRAALEPQGSSLSEPREVTWGRAPTAGPGQGSPLVGLGETR